MTTDAQTSGAQASQGDNYSLNSSPTQALFFDIWIAAVSAAFALANNLSHFESFWLSLSDIQPHILDVWLNSYLPFVLAITTLSMGFAIRFLKFPGMTYLNAGNADTRAVPSTSLLIAITAALGAVCFAFATSAYMSKVMGASHLFVAALLAVWMLWVPTSLLITRLFGKR